MYIFQDEMLTQSTHIHKCFKEMYYLNSKIFIHNPTLSFFLHTFRVRRSFHTLKHTNKNGWHVFDQNKKTNHQMHSKFSSLACCNREAIEPYHKHESFWTKSLSILNSSHNADIYGYGKLYKNTHNRKEYDTSNSLNI